MKLRYLSVFTSVKKSLAINDTVNENPSHDQTMSFHSNGKTLEKVRDKKPLTKLGQIFSIEANAMKNSARRKLIIVFLSNDKPV